MTARKPPSVSWQTWIDRQILQGEADGAFDDLPGAGRPLENLGGRRDEDWWIREKLRREGVEYLPPALRVAKEREDTLAAAMAAATEAEVVALVDAMNATIRYVNSHAIEGPPSTSVTIDLDDVLTVWRRLHGVAPASD